MCTVHFLLMYEERMPPGAASGGQQGAQKAAMSALLRPPGLRGASSGHRSRAALPLRCTPVGAGRRNPLARAEIRLRVCRWSAGTSAVTVAIAVGMPVM